MNMLADCGGAQVRECDSCYYAEKGVVKAGLRDEYRMNRRSRGGLRL